MNTIDGHPLRIAILTPWFLVNGGGTKVVSALAEMYPDADLFCLFAREQSVPKELKGRTLTCSFMQKIPAIARLYRPLLPLFPFAVESLDLRGYDVIISSDASLMKGVLIDQAALHICYCHTPVRYVWDLYWTFRHQTSWLSRPIFAASSHYIRQWDFAAAQRVHHFIANSEYIAKRIETYYRRSSTVIYPPVETRHAFLSDQRGDYYLSVGRLTHTKRLDVLIEACNRLGRRLLIAGAGREEAALKRIAGPTIEFLGRVSDDQLPSVYANSRAFLFAADEDFGIVPVEAQAYGKPVLAYRKGGALETVLEGNGNGCRTGLFFEAQTADALMRCIERFEREETQFNPASIQSHARSFDTSVFVDRMREHIASLIDTHFQTVRGGFIDSLTSA
jgi:glycosyltransferase involved in cell wall biosynthesis